MKRARLEEEEREQEEQSSIDWTRIFNMESILLVLHPYLSTPDLIYLSCVNKHMNTSWINNERRLSVLHMRERIRDMTGRVYHVKNPVRCIKSAYLNAQEPVKLAKGKSTFTCWQCQKKKSIRLHLVSHDLFKARTCLTCAQWIYINTRSLVFSAFAFHNIWDGIPKEDRVPYIGQWPPDLKKRIENFIRPHIITARFNDDYSDSYIHKDFLKEPIAWVREAFASPPQTNE